MSDLNVTLANFLIVLGGSALLGLLLRRWHWRGLHWGALCELLSAFSLAASRMEVRTIEELGGWAGGLGPDVTFTILFVTLLAHALSWPDASGNPCVGLQHFLVGNGPSLARTLLMLLLQLAGATLGRMWAERYWALELTDMHMIKNLMGAECTPTLHVSILQGGATELVCALVFHLLLLCVQQRSVFIRAPLQAIALTFLAFIARSYSSGFVNPALAYAVTFHCPGHTLLQYGLVYSLGPLAGMLLAVFLYMGHIPKLFSKNLLYSSKSRFRVPKKKESAAQSKDKKSS